MVWTGTHVRFGHGMVHMLGLVMVWYTGLVMIWYNVRLTVHGMVQAYTNGVGCFHVKFLIGSWTFTIHKFLRRYHARKASRRSSAIRTFPWIATCRPNRPCPLSSGSSIPNGTTLTEGDATDAFWSLNKVYIKNSIDLTWCFCDIDESMCSSNTYQWIRDTYQLTLISG